MIGTSYGDTESVIGLNQAQQGIDYALQFAQENQISPTSNLKDDPVWIFSAMQDHINPFANQLAQKQYYDHFGANIKFL